MKDEATVLKAGERKSFLAWKFSGFTIEFHCLLIHCCLIRKPIIFIVRRESTQGVKSVQRRLHSTQHVRVTSFDPVFGVKFAVSRSECRCLVFLDGREACEAISESFSCPFHQFLHSQSFYGMLTRLILVSAREVHLFLIPALPLPQMKFSHLVSLIKLASKFRNWFWGKQSGKYLSESLSSRHKQSSKRSVLDGMCDAGD